MGIFQVIKVVIHPLLYDSLDIWVLHQGGGILPGCFVFNKTVADEIFGH